MVSASEIFADYYHHVLHKLVVRIHSWAKHFGPTWDVALKNGLANSFLFILKIKIKILGP